MFFRFIAIIIVLLGMTACQTAGTSKALSGKAGDSVESYNVISENLPTFAKIPGDSSGARAADRVFFGFDSAVLTSSARTTLNRQVSWLKDNKNVNVTVEGHCDERGTREYNIALGERRATAVRNYLVNSGISSSRINVISYGKERPAVIGSNPTAWALNRRSVTVLVNYDN